MILKIFKPHLCCTTPNTNKTNEMLWRLYSELRTTYIWCCSAQLSNYTCYPCDTFRKVSRGSQI